MGKLELQLFFVEYNFWIFLEPFGKNFVYLQIQYSAMLDHIEPLRNELKTLEVKANENRRKNDDMMNLIGGLERSIGRYKEE